MEQEEKKRGMDARLGRRAPLAALGLILCLETALAKGPANTPGTPSRAGAPASAGQGKAVRPWVTERMEEKYCCRPDYRTPILPPIKEETRPPARMPRPWARFCGRSWPSGAGSRTAAKNRARASASPAAA